MEFPSWWRSPDGGVLKHFMSGPVPEGWEPAGGHYDYALGVWIDDEPEGKVDLKSLRAEYTARTGKKPFGGWSAKQLREKIA